jgi:hypothetical protein
LGDEEVMNADGFVLGCGRVAQNTSVTRSQGLSGPVKHR